MKQHVFLPPHLVRVRAAAVRPIKQDKGGGGLPAVAARPDAGDQVEGAGVAPGGDL
jgi:hypothetical protein